MNSDEIEAKLVVIRQYLSENVPESSVHDGPKQNGERTLIVIFGKAGYCSLQISEALLMDPDMTPVALSGRIRECNIAGKVLMKGSFYLNHDAISDDAIISL